MAIGLQDLTVGSLRFDQLACLVQPLRLLKGVRCPIMEITWSKVVDYG
jgi:hypothetical protein